MVKTYRYNLHIQIIHKSTLSIATAMIVHPRLKISLITMETRLHYTCFRGNHILTRDTRKPANNYCYAICNNWMIECEEYCQYSLTSVE